MFTMPHLVDELYELAGKKPTDYFRYHKLEEACRYFYPDQTRLTAWGNPIRFGQEVQEKLGVDSAQVVRHLGRARKKFELTKGIFLEKSLHKASTYFSRDVLRAVAHLPSLSLTATMDGHNRKHLGHPKLVQLFNRYATYNGSSPYKAPAVLNLIPHLEHGIGAAIPEGGMHAITRSLVRLAEESGVVFHLGSRVEEISVEGGRANGIKVAGQLIPADLVVCNMDIYPAYKHLLPRLKGPRRILEQPRSSSALIFYWGIRSAFPELGLHNIFFSADYQDEFNCIFDRKEVGGDPTVYVNITSKACPEDAPEGMENWFVMINVPHDQGQDWDAIRLKARADVIRKINASLGLDVEPLIVEEDFLDPPRIASKTSSHGGALYGASSNNSMAAFFRHANFSSGVKGLFFCGGSVHPGGGIPLCLLGAKIVADLVKEDYS